MNRVAIAPLVAPTKTEVLSGRLLDLARQTGPDAKLPTFRELCRSFRVSKATLDHALRELEQRRVIVRRHGSGIYVSAALGRKTIAVVLGTNIFTVGFSPFWLLLLQAARSQLQARGYRFHAYLDFPQGEDLLAAHQQLEDDLAAGRLDGLLAIAPSSADEVRWLQQWRVPLVVLPTPMEPAAWCAGLAPMVQAAVAELAGVGCRRLALLAIEDRGRFAEALEEAGLEFRSERLWTPGGAGYKGGWQGFEEFGYRTLQERWNAHAPPADGLVIADDVMARGALMALREAGTAVGRELRIAVGANKGSPLLQPYEKGLILLEYDPGELLAAAIGMLESLMNGGQPPRRQTWVEARLRTAAEVGR
jgi:DNA-binding LacI/PurR family transcriptional regulator